MYQKKLHNEKRKKIILSFSVLYVILSMYCFFIPCLHGLTEFSFYKLVQENSRRLVQAKKKFFPRNWFSWRVSQYHLWIVSLIALRDWVWNFTPNIFAEFKTSLLFRYKALTPFLLHRKLARSFKLQFSCVGFGYIWYIHGKFYKLIITRASIIKLRFD